MRIKQYEIVFNEEKQVQLTVKESKNYPNIENLDNPKKIAKMFSEVFQADKQVEEHMYLLCMDTKCHPVGVFEISHGTDNFTTSSAKSIFQRIFLCNGVNVVLCHNHPSGNTVPSKDDVKMTERFKTQCEMLDVNLLDHIIVGSDFEGHFTYHSFKEYE